MNFQNPFKSALPPMFLESLSRRRAEIGTPPPGTKAVYIPSEIFDKIQAAGFLVGLTDSVNRFVTEIMENTVDDISNLVDIMAAVAGNQQGEDDE